MSRGLSSANLAEVTAEVLHPILFMSLELGSGTVRIHSETGTFTWGGFDWLGVGDFGSISQVEEGSDLSRRTTTYGLTGITSAYLAAILGENYQGKPAKLYVGLLNLTTRQLVDTPELIDQGKLDEPEIKRGTTASITITAENRFSAWDRAQIRRITNADQQSRFPGDRGLEFVDQAAQKEIAWGRAS